MLKLSQPNICDEAIAAVARVLRSGQLVHGPECEAFERELAWFLDCSDVVLVSSGTAALHLALLALDVGPGDAVIVPDFTFPATANAVSMVGARPVLVDVARSTYTLSIEQLASVMENWSGRERLKAVIPVHEFGCPAEMDEIAQIARQRGLRVVEDAACALGAVYGKKKAGTLGDVGCFSFHPRKTLTTGEGGAVATNDAVIARRLRRLRSHGMERTQSGVHFVEPALNYRLTDFQAALGRVQLPELDRWIKGRRELVNCYLACLAPLEAMQRVRLPQLVDGHSWQTFMITLTGHYNRDEIISCLKHEGIEANLGAQSLSSLNLYGDQPCRYAVGPELFQCGLALPLHEKMTVSDVRHVCNALSTVLNS